MKTTEILSELTTILSESGNEKEIANYIETTKDKIEMESEVADLRHLL